MTKNTGATLSLIAGVLGLLINLIWIFMDRWIALPQLFSLNLLTISTIILSIILILAAGVAFKSYSAAPAWIILCASILLLISVYQLFPALLGIAGSITLLSDEPIESTSHSSI